MFEITEEVIDYNRVIAAVSSPSAGAISTFIGVTRNFTGKYDVETLFYEAYHEMAIKMMERIGREAASKYQIEKIAIVHRIGNVSVEEASVMIAVSSAHRKAAIEACWYAIDTLKEIVPIWKKEFMTDGEQKWIANDPQWN